MLINGKICEEKFGIKGFNWKCCLLIIVLNGHFAQKKFNGVSKSSDISEKIDIFDSLPKKISKTKLL